MKQKINYSYVVGGVPLATREAARVLQRSIKLSFPNKATPKIEQTVTIKRVVR